jgi:hypothetical protein
MKQGEIGGREATLYAQQYCNVAQSSSIASKTRSMVFVSEAFESAAQGCLTA